MENVLQELDAVVKDESTSLLFALSSKGGIFYKKNQ